MTNVYLDINPLTKKPFYVGIGNTIRCQTKFRNNLYHINLVNTFPFKKFKRIIIYKNIALENAYRLEKQIIKRCGRLFDNSGILANIHEGGPVNNLKGISTGVSKKRRIEAIGYTEKELKGFEITAKKQRGVPMAERIGDPNWVNSRKGKSFKEQYGENYVNPRKGIKQTEYDPNYISPTVKPFKLILNNDKTIIIWDSKEFKEITNLNDRILMKLRKFGMHCFTRQKWKYKHSYMEGDVLTYISITTDEYFQLKHGMSEVNK